MVFSGKIYDQIKEQLDKYLFGFDKSQLQTSLLKGKYYHSLIIVYFICRFYLTESSQYQT